MYKIVITGLLTHKSNCNIRGSGILSSALCYWCLLLLFITSTNSATCQNVVTNIYCDMATSFCCHLLMVSLTTWCLRT